MKSEKKEEEVLNMLGLIEKKIERWMKNENRQIHLQKKRRMKVGKGETLYATGKGKGILFSS